MTDLGSRLFHALSTFYNFQLKVFWHLKRKRVDEFLSLEVGYFMHLMSMDFVGHFMVFLLITTTENPFLLPRLV